eukprot:gene5638-7017_t
MNHHLKVLDLSSNHISDNTAFILGEALQTNETIEILNLSSNEIKRDGSCFIANALKHNTTVTKVLAKNKTLKKLTLKRNLIDPQGAEYITSGLLNNEGLTLSISPPIDSVTVAPLDFPTPFSNCIEDQGGRAASFSEIVLYNQTCTNLDLSVNWINSQGLYDLAQAFISNPSSSVTSIDISCNTICHLGAKYRNNLDPAGAIQPSHSLQQNSTLTFIELSANLIGDVGVHHLSEALQKNRFIVSISLSQSLITHDGVKSLVQLINNNSTITFLDLSFNHIGPLGAQELSHSLMVNKTIKSHLHNPNHMFQFIKYDQQEDDQEENQKENDQEEDDQENESDEL